MNQFTKEELKIMAINLCCNEDTTDILNKLNSMLDNYCEHKNQEIDCDGGISMVCVDCGHITMDV